MSQSITDTGFTATSDTVDRAHEILSRMKEVSEQLSGLVGREQPEHETSRSLQPVVDTANLSLDQQLKRMEDRMLARFQASENYLTDQMEEQSLAIGMMVGIFVMSSLYIFYYLVENLLRVYRCRCPQLKGWDMVVKAAKFSIEVERQQQIERAVHATVPQVQPQPAMVSTATTTT